MAVREGLCSNCGSLIHVDTEQNNNHCIFCWAPVQAEEAVHLLKDSSGHTFPNETYEAPEGETQKQALSSYQNNVHTGKARKTKSAEPVQKKAKPNTLSPAEQVAKMGGHVPPVKVHKMLLLQIVIAIVLILGLFFGLTIPATLSRDASREELAASLKAKDSQLFDIDIRGRDNNILLLATHEKLSESKLEELSKLYQEIYEAHYGQAPNNLVVKLYGAEGEGSQP